jgi:protein-S-isoprenylcysteine O-methyltransferase Ste14
MPSWARIATRSRVPLGFLFAAAYLWFAHPTWITMSAGGLIVVVGLGIRAAASGHIRKNAQLAVTGPYAYTRNPLYLGSIVMAVGFIVAARELWIGVGALAMFLFIYVPVIRAEEAYLRSAFPEYEEYCSHVPRFFPRLTAYQAGANDGAPAFSRELYMRHREYNAILGSALVLGALILKIVLV